MECVFLNAKNLIHLLRNLHSFRIIFNECHRCFDHNLIQTVKFSSTSFSSFQKSFVESLESILIYLFWWSSTTQSRQRSTSSHLIVHNLRWCTQILEIKGSAKNLLTFYSLFDEKWKRIGLCQKLICNNHKDKYHFQNSEFYYFST